MYYVLATTDVNVRWYKATFPDKKEPGAFELLKELDLRRVETFPDKKSAKLAALELGLKTWRYVKF